MDRNTYAFGDDAGNLAARAREIGLQHRAALLRESGDRHSYAAGMLGSTKLQLAVLASFDPDYDHDDEPPEPRRASVNDAAGFRPLERVPSWLAEVEERRQQRSEHGSLESLRGGFTLNQAFLAVIKSAVGPAVLYMPKGFQEGGLCFSLGMLVLSFALFSLGATRLLEAWEGCRKSYAAMMGLAFGHRGVLVVRFTIVAQQCGICLTYFIFVATNLRELVMYACPSFAAPSLAQCCLLQVLAYAPLSCIRNMQNFALTNLVANALILYSLVVLAVYGTVEVVEHLDPAPLAAFGDAVLGRCAPRVAIVTTPNKEYNECFRTEGLSKGQFNPLERPPPLAALELRNSDHRFEWTRAEFKEWADGLAARYGYTVRFRGAGGGDWHADPPYDESVTGQELLERGVGPATQVAIFEATTEAPAPDAEAVAAWMGPAPERVWAA